MYSEEKIGQINRQIEAQEKKFETMLAEIASGEKTRGRVEFDICRAKEVLEGVGQISEEILKVGSKLQKVIQTLTQAENDRKVARKQHDRELDVGNREEANNCLDRVKAAIEKSHRCRKEFEEVQPAILPLYQELKKLRTIAGELKTGIERSCMIIDDWHKRADLIVGSTVTTLSFINELNNLVTSFTRESKND